ncbi:hypothetical protein HWV62_29340 [Athelia sp. TMB]|nr:hypothetical protein HWV62_29340 [Athelia sp. TMB]
MKALIPDGITRDLRLRDREIDFNDFGLEEQREHRVFEQLLKMVPDLYERWDQSDEAGEHLCDMLQKGIANARSEDTKGLKTAVISWIRMQLPGGNMEGLEAHLKTNRGFNHPLTGKLLCPVNMDWNDPLVVEGLRSGTTKLLGVHWPRFLYADLEYDREKPWKGLFRGELLIKGYRHIFTSPSSVYDGEPRATRSGNARIHGMIKVTLASIAYVATQVRFSLSSHSVFSRNNCVTETEQFYNTCMDLFLDPRERSEITALLSWWNEKIFPASLSAEVEIPLDTPLARIRAIRDAEEAAKRALTQPTPTVPPEA